MELTIDFLLEMFLNYLVVVLDYGYPRFGLRHIPSLDLVVKYLIGLLLDLFPFFDNRFEWQLDTFDVFLNVLIIESFQVIVRQIQVNLVSGSISRPVFYGLDMC